MRQQVVLVEAEAPRIFQLEIPVTLCHIMAAGQTCGTSTFLLAWGLLTGPAYYCIIM